MGQQRNWTQAELDILYDHFGLVKNEVLSKKLNRSVCGLKQKAYHMGLVQTKQFITAYAAGEIFNISTGIVLTWIKSGALKAKRSTVGVGRHMAWHIDHDDLVKFVKTRYDLFDPYKVDRQLQPYWRNLVDKALPKDFTPTNGRHWTEFEDAYLLNNRAKLTIPELATRLKRTKEAVHGRLVLLRRKGRMMPYKELWQIRKSNGTAKAPRKWTPEEDRFLKEHWGQLRTGDESNLKTWGNRYTSKEIAEHLGRTVTSCWSRASRLGLINENWNKDKAS
jgi:hypothetical protein